jgi:hypothetical protein
MRATINFDIDLDRVEDTMATLVSQEAATLHITANILDNLGHGPLLQEVQEALGLLQETTSQLLQYRDMLASFEQAKFQTMLPQEAPATNIKELQSTLGAMNEFGSFVDRLNESSQEEESTDELQTQEG